ncbi:MAG: peptide-methionine (S)-S-oxide reductase [Lancefieldella parvula]|uniref:peptide-methionine (S)-S-oxide reductase n=1 Tax=Lancefieldella parvula TaxID=1382 RepID=A0A9E7DBV9_9ACTN|nr:MAG: peptide-methionine (S)-S-oxide reductase [Lancefieldella parvula]
MAEIYLAGGCFWGLEEYFSRIKGVTATTVGYANGKTLDTNYQEVKGNRSRRNSACHLR